MNLSSLRNMAKLILLALVAGGSAHQNTVMRLLATLFVTCTTKPGQLYCSSDCKAVVLCTGTAEGQVAVEQCNETTACDSTTLMCEPVKWAVCTPPRSAGFRCTTPGVFPDPADCRRYHTCARTGPRMRLQRDSAICSAGEGFHLLAGECVPQHEASTCPLPACEVPGQMEPLAENRNIYYICVVEQETGELVHWLFRCPPQQLFEGNRCISADNSPDSIT